MTPDRSNIPDWPLNAEIESAIAGLWAFVKQEIEFKNRALADKERTLEEIRLERNTEKEKLSAMQHAVTELNNQLEANRQLTNKLLGDMARMQQDIDWYRRTYEQRSLLGTLKEKLMRKIR